MIHLRPFAARFGWFHGIFGEPIIPLAKSAFLQCPSRLRCVCATAMIAESGRLPLNSIQ